MRKTLLILLISLATFAQENPLKYVDFYDVEDVNFDVFDNPKYQKFYNRSFDKKTFFKHYFRVWNEKQSISENDLKEFFNYDQAVKKSPCIAENYNELSEKIISEIKNNLPNPTEKDSEIKYGLTLKTVSLRRFPTTDFCFKNVRNAGEGYPFDYFQYSTLWIASPVAVLTQTQDGLWYFVNSQNNKGWVKSDDVVLLTKRQVKKFQKMNFATPTKDKIVLKSKTKSYKIFLGTLLPLVNGKLLLPNKKANNRLKYDKIAIEKSFKKFPIVFSKNIVKQLLTELHYYKYTWGGLNEGRDCSSTLKDFYTPFGLWLPRNSGQQAKVGEILNLQGSNAEKMAVINQKSIPFLTMLYKRGHIVLYVGKSKSNTPIIFQNVWGIKVFYKNKTLYNLAEKRLKYGLFGFHKKSKNDVIQTRFNIGKAVFTNIEPSKNIDKTFENITTESFLHNFNTLVLLVK